MKRKTTITEPIQTFSLPNKLRMMAAGTRIIQDQAILMEAAQRLERLETELALLREAQAGSGFLP